ncbi:putative pentatricopeptide repeat-containing protein [Hibiscus syriacus]|uniref:Exportin-4 n=1 Tax=Hibiscus syriacus TaxID=106335 RepID=A0A6A2X042_HIBSY|nr:putative pentatricopeptide repeat-containing protein [Hibiscus syriacus]
MQGFSDGGADLGQLQTTMRHIEVACTSIQMHINPAAAEATILSLSQSPKPYAACRFILENSQVPNARFQAAAAIRDAAIREWSSLSAEERRSLISFCLCFVMQHASSPEGYVLAKVSSVAAQLMKRGWLDFTETEKEAFFYQVNQAFLGAHGVDVQFIGVNFLESLVSEFSPSTSSAMGLPREFHEQCRTSLELNYLKMFYCWARDASLSATNEIMEPNAVTPEVKVCTAALRLMLQILNWDFRNDTTSMKAGIDVFSAGVRHDNASSKRSECVLVQPGPAWFDVLISSGHVSWLLSLYASLRQKFSRESYWIDCPIAVSARKLIVQLCSLTGTIFPSDNGKMQENHLLQLLSGILQWIDPPDVVSKGIEEGKSESEMLDGCRALLSIATATTPFVFDQLLKSIRPYGTLTLLSTLMCEVVKVLMTNNSDEETWSWEARDILLDTWTILLVVCSNVSGQIGLDWVWVGYLGFSDLEELTGKHAAANLFAMIVESELKVASASVANDDGDSDYLQASISAMDERLSSYALIARAAIDVTIPLLTRLFSERFARLHQGRGIIDPTETLEELYSLLLITGHVLADEGEGETPLFRDLGNLGGDKGDGGQWESKDWLVLGGAGRLSYDFGIRDLGIGNIGFKIACFIFFLEKGAWPSSPMKFKVPTAIQIHFVDIVEAEKHPVGVLSGSIIRFAEQSMDPEVRETVFSPRLMEAVIWFLARWTHTYLMPLEETNCLSNNVYQQHQSMNSKKALLSFFGEHSQGQVVLDIIVRISVMTLMSYPGENDLQESWRNLSNAFSNEKSLFLLSSANQRSLAQTLVLSASGLRNSEAANQYVRGLMVHMTTYLVELSSRSDLKSVAHQPDIIMSVSCLLERLRGAASAAGPRRQRAMYEIGISVMNPVLHLLEVYKDEFYCLTEAVVL